MSVMPDAPHIEMKDLRKFPRPVAKLITEAVNKHAVKYRMLSSGNVIRIYSGSRDVIPLKVAADRPAEHSVRFMLPWFERHVDGWLTDDVSPSSIEILADVLNSEPKREKKIVAKPVVVPDPPEEKWTDYKYGFETDGTTYRCKKCGWSRDTKIGIHLHTCNRDPEIDKGRKKGNEVNSLKQSQTRIMRQQAVRVLAEQNGMKVVDKDDVTNPDVVKELNMKVRLLETRISALTREKEDTEARFALMKEALDA